MSSQFLKIKAFLPLLLLVLVSHVPYALAEVEVWPGVLYKVSDSHGPIEFDFSFRAFALYFTEDFFMITDLDGRFQSIGFSCSPSFANLTVKGVTRNNIRGTLSLRIDAPSLTQSIIKVYVGVEGKPSDVKGCDSWNYNGGSKILTIRVNHESSRDVEVEWGYVSAFLEGNMGLGLRLVGGMGVLVLVFSILMGFLAGNMDVQAVVGVIGTAITISFLVMLRARVDIGLLSASPPDLDSLPAELPRARGYPQAFLIGS
jgi:hypothetical protein